MNTTWSTGGLVALTLALTACGGGNDTPVAPATVGLPAEVATSPAALLGYVMTLGADDTGEPLALGDTQPAKDDTSEPTVL